MSARWTPGQAQIGDPLAARLAELKDPALGSADRVHDVAAELRERLRVDTSVPIDWARSVTDYRVALQVRDVPRLPVAKHAWHVSMALRDAGHVWTARTLLEHALGELAEIPREETFACWLHIELAEITRHAGEWTTSAEHLEEARIGLFGEDSDPFEAPLPAEDLRAIAVGTWFDMAGQLYFELGRTELAARNFDEHEERALETGEPSLWWGALDNHIRLAFSTKRFRELERLWREAQAHPFWARGRTSERANISFTVARAFLEEERLGHREPGEAFEMLVGIATAPGAHEFEAFGAELLLAATMLDEKELEEADAWIEAARERSAGWGPSAKDGGRTLLALKATEWRAARVSASPARVAQAEAESNEIFERFLKSWAEAPIAPDGIGFLQTPWRAQFLNEVLALRLSKGVRPALEDLLRVQSLGTLTRTLLESGVDLADVQHELLGPGAGAVLFSLGREQSFVFTLSQNDVKVHKLAGEYRLSRTQAALSEAAFDLSAGLTRSDSAFEEAVRGASALLLPSDLAQTLRTWTEIVVVGAEGAGIFAFDALLLDGEPIGTQKAISHIPSLPIGVWLTRRLSNAAPPAPGIEIVYSTDTRGAPPPFDRLEPIPFDEDHVDALSSLYGSARLWYGPEAREDKLAGAGLEDASALSFIAHGLYSPERPQPAGLLLAGGDLLWAEDIEAMSVPPLVSLIACGAGRGNVRVGDDGRTHLGAAFLKAGARNVLLGSLDLEFRAGLSLHLGFHERIRAGDTPAEALRSARAQTIASRVGGVHPIQLLSVRLYGAGHEHLPPLPGEENAAWWIVAAAPLGLILLGYLFLGRRGQKQGQQALPTPPRR